MIQTEWSNSQQACVIAPRGGWNLGGWFKIHPETIFDHTTQNITAFSRTPENIDLFVIGFDNAMWSTFWTAGGGLEPRRVVQDPSRDCLRP